MMQPAQPYRVFLAVGSTDMRKSINSLSIMVEQVMGQNPFTGDLFVFCNRKRSMIKILYWHYNGFSVYAELHINGKTGCSPVLPRVLKPVPISRRKGTSPAKNSFQRDASIR